jgi:geranylgeranyl diphosphate synthase, type II
VSGFDLASWLPERRRAVDALLAERLVQPAAGQDPGRLIEAMRYSLLAPGKRLRPILALGAAEAVGGRGDDPPVKLAAAAVELVHCYSLIHDDLPSMDDDDFRRGQPTSHKAFGEATAILAGDALLTLAFEWLGEAGAMAGENAGAGYLRAVTALAKGAGMWGMVRGQARDLGEPTPTSLSDIEQLHREKTGALFVAAVSIGGAVAGASVAQMSSLARYADRYGVAFQHADDRDDAEHAGFAEDARRRMHVLVGEALTALDDGGFDGRAEPLRALARALASRAKTG